MVAIALPRGGGLGSIAQIGIAFLMLSMLLILLSTVTLTIPIPNSHPNINGIALVENERTWIILWPELLGEALSKIGGGTVELFPTCEALFAKMESVGSRYRLYWLDNDLNNNPGDRFMKGPQCISGIRALHPGALVVGNSAGLSDPGFMDNGANGFVKKGGDIAEAMKLVITLLSK